MLAGSIDSGAYGTSCPSCQPRPSVHLMVTMWSVKCRPKPGAARIASRSTADSGCADGFSSIVGVVMCVSFTVSGLSLPTCAAPTRRTSKFPAVRRPRLCRLSQRRGRGPTCGSGSAGDPCGQRVADLDGGPYGQAGALGEVGLHGTVDTVGLGVVAEVPQ